VGGMGSCATAAARARVSAQTREGEKGGGWAPRIRESGGREVRGGGLGLSWDDLVSSVRFQNLFFLF
jgi:hypothetical protein